MRYIHIIAISSLFLILQRTALGQIKFSGFADILFHSSESRFQIGQMELDITSELHPAISFEGALALNPDTYCFEAGTGFIELTFPEEKGQHSARGAFFNHTGLSLGLFDVPFGLDWQHIASPDRRLVTPPLLNEKSINGWNDMGANFHTDIGITNLVIFIVNGAAEGYSIGGRIACTPSQALGVGLSLSTQTEANDVGSKPQIIGGDLEGTIGSLSTRMEVQYVDGLREGDFAAIDSLNTHRGFYVQTDLDLTAILKHPLALIGRYGDWSTVNNSEEARRATFGVAYTPIPGFEVRAEFLMNTINEKQHDQRFVVQTLVIF